MAMKLSARELAYCGVLGAAALTLPFLFHVLHLGHVFMPMYLPLMTLAFFVRPAPAALTAFLTPLLSGATTGMPPFYPPVAVLMAVELAVMAAAIGLVRARWPRVNEWALLLAVLAPGRVLYVAEVYVTASFLQLPAGFLAGASLLSGWPGVVLMMAVVPPIARGARRLRPVATSEERSHP
jgi:hypothetical protein